MSGVDTSPQAPRFADPDETLAKDEKRIEQAVQHSTQGATWNKPNIKEQPNYAHQMTAEEEMDMLRKRRKELEEKLRREGKLNEIILETNTQLECTEKGLIDWCINRKKKTNTDQF